MREFPFHLYRKWHPQEQIGADGFSAIAELHDAVQRALADPAVTDLVIVDTHERLVQTCRGVTWAFHAMLIPKYGQNGLQECEIYTPPAADAGQDEISRKCSEERSLPPAA